MGTRYAALSSRPPGRPCGAQLLLSVIACCISAVCACDSGSADATHHGADPPSVTNRIVLTESRTLDRDGVEWTIEAYENRAYTCARSGYSSFVVAYRAFEVIHELRPLWLFLHGGGFGAFDRQGVYQPEHLTAFLSQDPEGAARLASDFMTAEGLRDQIASHPAGFRHLAISMCDHDVYSGVGELDPGNPYQPDENGEPRKTDGLLAARAALFFTVQRFHTAHVFAHGHSAGAIGAKTLALSLGREGRSLSGIIVDSGHLGPLAPSLVAHGCLVVGSDIYDRFTTRAGRYVQPGGYPHELISEGFLRTPVFDIQSIDDRSCFCNGRRFMLTDASGHVHEGSACELLFAHEREALRARPDVRTRIFRVCVDQPDRCGPDEPGCIESPCDLHSPTIYNAIAVGGDTSREHAPDYNEAISRWVDERLEEDPSSL